MPHADRSVPLVSLVVRWPNSVPAAVADQLARRLSDAHLSATWAIEEPAQAGALEARAAGSAEITSALFVAASGSPSAAIDTGLSKFQKAGVPIQAVQMDAKLARGSFERRLCQAGVRAVVASPTSAKSSLVRPLPFGVWELGPHVVIPPRRKLLGLLSGSPQPIIRAADPSPAIASIDIARIGAANGGNWRSVDQLIDDAASHAAAGAARIVSIAEIAAELAGVAAPRPQRSILRAAA
ncbi:MAG TPA: hypothetical protein VF175_04125 [Lacipirellula sp.]